MYPGPEGPAYTIVGRGGLSRICLGAWLYRIPIRQMGDFSNFVIYRTERAWEFRLLPRSRFIQEGPVDPAE